MNDNEEIRKEEKSEMTFEEAYAELQKTVALLEGGDAPLDKSLELFEKGVSLVRFCNKKLSEAEQKIITLTAGDGEQI